MRAGFYTRRRPFHGAAIAIGASLAAAVAGLVLYGAVWGFRDAITWRQGVTYPIRVDWMTARSDPRVQSSISSVSAVEAPRQGNEGAQVAAAKVLKSSGDAPPLEVSQTPPVVLEAKPYPARALGILKLAYRLDSSSGAFIEVKKPVIVDGVDKGKITLRISSGSTVLVNAKEAAALAGEILPDNESALLTETDYVSFERLRTAGVTVRYDAINDRLIMAGLGR